MYTVPVADLEQIYLNVRSFWPRDKDFLITGGTGFFGRWLVESIHYIETKLNCKNSYTLTSRQDSQVLTAKIPVLKESFFKLKQFDLEKKFNFDEPVHYVIHAASDVSGIKKGTAFDFSSLVKMTQNVVEAVKKYNLNKFLNVSSGGVYSPQIVPYKEDDVSLNLEKNIDSYGSAKRQSEIIVKDQIASSCSARCFAFVGPYCDEKMAVMQMLFHKINHKPIEVRSPEVIRSFMYPTDLVISLFNLLLKPNQFRNYNVGSNESITLLELARKISNDIIVTSNNTPALAGNFYCPNTDRYTIEYGSILNVDLETSLKKTLSFLQERKNL